MGARRSGAEAEAEEQAGWAARTTAVLFVVAWAATGLFSLVWDCGSSCVELYGRMLASLAVGGITMLPSGALVVLGAWRLRRRLERGRGARLGPGVAIAGSVLGMVIMTAAFLLATYANAGAMEGLGPALWIPSSIVSALVVAVYAAIVGAGSWQVATMTFWRPR